MTRREIARCRFPHCEFPGSHCREATFTRVMRGAALLLTSALTVAGFLMPAAARADYPARFVKILVPYPAGGATDVLTRLVAKELQERLGQPFIVDNKPGAATNIAATLAARSAPDGYTLFLATIASHALNKWSYKKLDYDPDEFAAVGMLGQNTFYLVVAPSSPANSVQDLIRMARQRTDGLTYASNGEGSPNHLLGEQFRQRADIKLLHVPYKGSSESNADVKSGRVDFMFDGGAIAWVNAGQLKALAVAYPKRWPTQPEIPTMAEAGFPDITISTFFGLVAPANTPPEILDKLNEAVRSVLNKNVELEKKMTPMGIVPFITTRQETADFLKQQSEKWRPIIKSVGIRFE
jgi:tripartite-type tricarboxylate transporter receptor subunit TctC